MNSLNLNWYEIPSENNIHNLVSFLLSVFLAFPIFFSAIGGKKVSSINKQASDGMPV